MKKVIYFVIFAAVFYPIYFWYQGVNLVFSKIVLLDIFPALGLLAFSMMWLHIVGGALRPWIEKQIDFDSFVLWSSVVTLLAIVLHPILLLVALYLSGGGRVLDYVRPGQEYLIYIAVVALVVFVTYDILKLNKHRKRIAKHWTAIKFVSTLGFFLVLIHSLGVGRDLQTGNLRTLWYFYGVTASLATVKNYIINPYGKKKNK